MFDAVTRRVHLPPVSISLDVKGGDVAFISHAHSDHAVRSAEKLICSRETLALLKCRKYSRKTAGVVYLDGVKLLDAGHVYGSKQILIENGHKFLYTGDLRPSPSLTAGQAEVVQCDELFIEATYGSPRYVFPNRIEVGQQIAKWAKQNEARGEITVIGGYSLGKAQEVIAHLNESGIAPLVSNAIVEVSNCYNSLGCKLDFLPIDSEEGKSYLKGGFTAVLPLSHVTPELSHALKIGYNRNVNLGACTGWSINGTSRGIVGFPLSDHADFNELIHFVEGTGAKKVYCAYGFSAEFAVALRRKGIDAVAIDVKAQPQRMLAAFQTV